MGYLGLGEGLEGFELSFGQRNRLNGVMDSADGLFHDRGETDADELALVVVGLVDKGLVLADEE